MVSLLPLKIKKERGLCKFPLGTVWGLWGPCGDCVGTVQAQGKAEGHARCEGGPRGGRHRFARPRECRGNAIPLYHLYSSFNSSTEFARRRGIRLS